MKFPLSWLKSWIDPQLTTEELAHRLTMAGLEVDGVEPRPLPFRGVVVGEVLETKPHPEAEKLCIATVSDGAEQFQVVCGAPNCRAGMKTPFARVGAVLTDEKGKDFKIKKAKLRGVESFGMLCARDELGLGEDKERGIAELPEDLEVGADFGEIVGDEWFEVSLTPNLGHCFSILGIARELHAMTGAPITEPKMELKEGSTPNDAEVAVETDGCTRYAARKISGVQVGPSPQWVVDRLAGCGMRSVNNVVDATNLVMLELGQPLHAFDADKVSGGITVKEAARNETLVTLDGVERKISEGTILICDKKGTLAAGGVMGGQASEVSDGTTNLLLEAAHFNPHKVRKGAKELGVTTESSRRFERGVDPKGVIHAIDRLAALIQQLAGGEVAKGVVEVGEPPPSRKIPFRFERANQILGTQLGLSEVEELLSRLEFSVGLDGQVAVPSYRNDVTEEIDLVEEVGRLYGYNHIPARPPKYRGTTIPHTPLFLFEREVRSRLLGQGLQELITNSLISPEQAETSGSLQLPRSKWIEVLNPSSVEQSVMRPSLLPGLLQVVSHNQRFGEGRIGAFEIGQIHFREESSFEEQGMVGILLAGPAEEQHWDRKERPADFFDLKGTVESLLAGLGLGEAEYKRSDLPAFHPGRQASIQLGSADVGTLGEVHPAVLRASDVKGRVQYAVLNLQDLIAKQPTHHRAEGLGQFPGSERDWTVSLPEEKPIGEVFSALQAVPSRLLRSITLLDIYQGEGVPAGMKNCTFRFVYRDRAKTLSVKAVEAEHERIINGATQSG